MSFLKLVLDFDSVVNLALNVLFVLKVCFDGNGARFS